MLTRFITNLISLLFSFVITFLFIVLSYKVPSSYFSFLSDETGYNGLIFFIFIGTFLFLGTFRLSKFFLSRYTSRK